MGRRIAAAVAAVLVLVHGVAYVGSGWIARTFLARRTLDGERQSPEQWTALLHDIVLRSGVVLAIVLATALALVANRRMRAELVGLYHAADSPRRLGVFRAIFFTYILFAFNPEQTLLFARLPPVLIRGLSDPLPLWRLIVPAPALAVVLVKVFLALSFFAAIGLCTRVSALGVAGIGFYLLGLPQIFGKVNHNHHLLWFALILALAPSGDGFAIDAWLRARLRAADARPPGKSRAYGLPIRVIWVLIGLIYFWPGFWKLVQHGPSWVLPENFRGHLYLRWFEDEGFSPLFRIDRHPWLCTIGSCFTIAFEMSWIFLVPFRRTRPLAVAMGLLFHNMTAAILNISFTSLQTCYAVFVDWDAVLRWIERRKGPMADSIRSAWAALDARAASALRRVASAPWAAAGARLALRRPSAEESLRAVRVAGVILFVVNMAYGALHQTDAWPFTCYPTFSTIIKPEHRTLYARIRSPSSGDRAVASLRAMEALRSERYAALLYGVVHERDPGRRKERLEALSTVLYEIDDSIRPGETIDIHEAVFSTDPDEARSPRGDELVYSARIGTTR